jgi:hypothetical protein
MNIGDCTVGDESLETELLIAISRFFLGSLLTGDKLFTKDLPIPTSRSPLSLIAARSRSSHSTLTSLPFMCMTDQYGQPGQQQLPLPSKPIQQQLSTQKPQQGMQQPKTSVPKAPLSKPI